MTDVNVPQNPVGTSAPSLPQSTKPRVIPGGGGDMPGAPSTFDPNAMNGAANLPAPPSLGAETVTADTTQAPQVTDQNAAVQQASAPRVAAIAEEIIQSNPGLSFEEAHGIAARAFNQYLVREPGWDHNPLAVVAARDLDPEPPQGQGEPLPPQGPQEPAPRTEDVPGGAQWYQQQGETPRDLANAVVPADNTLWDRMTGGHEGRHGGKP